MEKKYVYLVRQTQPVDYYDQRTIAVFDDENKALELARALNKEYGYGVRFDENHDFVDYDDDYEYDNVHYYDIDCQELNPDMNKYLGVQDE